MKTHDLTITALFTAVICVLSVITIPIGPVPISLSIFAIMLAAISLGVKKGVFATLIYILIGALGIPVFAGFKGGFHVLFGPTGGFIWSYIFIALIVSVASEKTTTKLTLFIFSLLSLLVCYLFGSLQYTVVTNAGFTNALSVCVYPFIVVDILKAVLAVNKGLRLKKIIK